MQTYSELSIPEKVRAILAAVLEPVSMKYSLHLGQINTEDLDANQLAEIDKIFSHPDVEIKQGWTLKYRLNEPARDALAKTVDMVSVGKVIAETIIKDLKGNFDMNIDEL